MIRKLILLAICAIGLLVALKCHAGEIKAKKLLLQVDQPMTLEMVAIDENGEVTVLYGNSEEQAAVKTIQEIKDMFLAIQQNLKCSESIPSDYDFEEIGFYFPKNKQRMRFCKDGSQKWEFAPSQKTRKFLDAVATERKKK